MNFINSSQVIPGLNSAVMILLIAWSLAWKGWALWRAARNDHKVWYVVLLVLNTIGILEIIYIFGFSGWKKKA